jgi:hypothetical protein
MKIIFPKFFSIYINTDIKLLALACKQQGEYLKASCFIERNIKSFLFPTQENV